MVLSKVKDSRKRGEGGWEGLLLLVGEVREEGVERPVDAEEMEEETCATRLGRSRIRDSEKGEELVAAVAATGMGEAMVDALTELVAVVVVLAVDLVKPSNRSVMQPRSRSSTIMPPPAAGGAPPPQLGSITLRISLHRAALSWGKGLSDDEAAWALLLLVVLVSFI